MRWEQGRSVIDALLKTGELERVSPSQEHAAELLRQGRKHIESARSIADADRAGAVQLVYDAARKALCAILENQGLRPTSKGGHIAVLEGVSAQLDPPMGKVLQPFDRLRRQRNEVEYRSRKVPLPTPAEVADDIGRAEEMLDLGLGVIDEMSPY